MDSLTNTPYWPFLVLLIGIICVIFSITKLRFHPFIALMVSALIVGLVSGPFEGMEGSHLLNAIELPMVEFGSIVGKIAWVIALAAIIGTAMMESGAAIKIVNSLTSVFGEKNGSIALLLSGFILSIPVFFDTVFFLLIPVIIAFASKTGKNYILYILAAGGAAAVAHSTIPPTPGPLVVAEVMNIDIGVTILAGIAIGILPAIASYIFALRVNSKVNIPIRVPHPESVDDIQTPSLVASVMPIVVPIILISLTSILNVANVAIPEWINFLGNKNIAMAIGTVLAITTWVKQKQLNKESLWNEIGKPLEIAGVIILITGAGGAFGAMIKHSGIGQAIELATADFHIHYVLLAWLISAAIKTAQGSSTVALITTSGIMYAIVGNGADLPYHPVYILLSIGFGGIFISWMNDSGFWVVAKMSGLTEKEALKTFTVTLAIAAVVGLIELILLSYILPLK
ncbi:MAG: GntP family permease [Bacteroidota bacterium]